MVNSDLVQNIKGYPIKEKQYNFFFENQDTSSLTYKSNIIVRLIK